MDGQWEGRGEMRATERRVSYTVLRLGPVDLGEPIPDNTVGIAVGDLNPACGTEGDARVAMPAHIRRHSDNGEPSASSQQAGSSGPTSDGTSCGAADCCRSHRWPALAESIITELENSKHHVGGPLRGRSTAYVVIVAQPPGSGHRSEGGGPVTLWRPRPVDRAIKIMEADPAAPLSMADLARAADVSVRTLQAAFLRHTGVSPMEYLRHIRLARVHEDLLTADPRHHTVARIAHRHGFPHLGRFAATYRARYGLNPSDTLRLQSVAEHPPGTSSEAAADRGSAPGSRGCRD
jgi:AraC-like DNA-binding protein